MKIYASAPLKDREQLIRFQNLITHLRKQGHTVTDVYSSEKYPAPEDIDYHVQKYKEAEKAIKLADAVIIEVSYPGRRIGFEIARALGEKKIVIALFKKGSKLNVSPIIGNRSKNYILQEYGEDNLIENVERALKEAKKLLDTKFILIISPEIDQYLEWSSDTRRMHKAQIVRNAVEEAMKKDKEYKAYQKEL